jgi:hypothetical protein
MNLVKDYLEKSFEKRESWTISQEFEDESSQSAPIEPPPKRINKR